MNFGIKLIHMTSSERAVNTFELINSPSDGIRKELLIILFNFWNRYIINKYLKIYICNTLGCCIKTICNFIFLALLIAGYARLEI